MQYIISDTFKISGPSFNDWKFMLFYLAAIPSSIFVPGTKKIFFVYNLFSPGRFEPVLASVCWYYLYPNFLKDRRCCCNSYKDNLKRKGLKPCDGQFWFSGHLSFLMKNELPCCVLPHPMTLAYWWTNECWKAGKQTGEICSLNTTSSWSLTKATSFRKFAGL